MKIEIWTDGSCRGNGQKNAIGAAGFIVFEDDKPKGEFVKVAYNTTNQRMEIIAMLDACLYAAQHFDAFTDVHFYTDSAYLHNCITQRWYDKWQVNGWVNSKKQPVANKDIWELLIPYFSYANFHFHKTNGHAGIDKNEMVDTLVQNATLKEVNK